jgi:hypothetical protein
LNAFAERWLRSVKSDCLSKLILFGEAILRCAVTQFIQHYHLERTHQGKANQLLFPAPVSFFRENAVHVWLGLSRLIA